MRRDAAIGEILEAVVRDDTGLIFAVERGLDDQLVELNVPVGEVDRLRGAGEAARVAAIGRVAGKLSMMCAAYVLDLAEVIRAEVDGRRMVDAA